MEKRRLILILFITMFTMVSFGQKATLDSTMKRHQAKPAQPADKAIMITPKTKVIEATKPNKANEGYLFENSIDEFGEEDEADFYIPSHDIYDIWTNESLNPYKVDINSLPDTTWIDCSGFVFPVAKEGKPVTSEFGARGRRYHYGTDIGIKTGDTIVAAFDGVVRLVSYDRGGYGNYIVIRHTNGLESLYGHLSRSIAKPNQVVKAGELIGLGGSTGRSTGPHLHFEFRFLGNPLNTKHIIDYDNETIAAEKYCLTKKTFRYKSAADKLKQMNSQKKFHKVRQGETLSHIAKRYGTTVGKLCKLNHLSQNSVISVGRSIRYR